MLSHLRSNFLLIYRALSEGQEISEGAEQPIIRQASLLLFLFQGFDPGNLGGGGCLNPVVNGVLELEKWIFWLLTPEHLSRHGLSSNHPSLRCSLRSCSCHALLFFSFVDFALEPAHERAHLLDCLRRKRAALLGGTLHSFHSSLRCSNLSCRRGHR